MAPTKQQVLDSLAKVPAPDGTPLTEDRRAVRHRGDRRQGVLLDHRRCRRGARPGSRCASAPRRRCARVPGVTSALVALTAERKAGAAAARPRQPAPPAPRAAARRAAAAQAGVPGVDAIIAVASGKGGVGKSTTAVNLALGLRDPRPQGRRARRRHLRAVAAEAARDQGAAADASAARGSSRSTRYGLTVMSIGFLIEEETPMIWRGPMVMSALTQMLREVEWGDARRDGGRHAARHRRRAAHHGAAGAAQGRGHRLDAAGSRADRRAARHRHVPARQRAGARHRREHELLPLPALRRRAPTSSATAARGTKPSGSACRSSARCRCTWTIREKSDAGLPVVATEPDGPHAADLSRHRRARCAISSAGGGAQAGAEDRDRGVSRRVRALAAVCASDPGQASRYAGSRRLSLPQCDRA